MIPTYAVLVVIWLVVGFGYSVAQTPSGRLPRRLAHPRIVLRSLLRNSPCPMRAGSSATPWPVASVLPWTASTFIVMSLIGLVGVGLALRLWARQ
jgi:hypothetical protein